MIKLVRCDDRMIHGQCIVRILADFAIECTCKKSANGAWAV